MGVGGGGWGGFLFCEFLSLLWKILSFVERIDKEKFTSMRLCLRVRSLTYSYFHSTTGTRPSTLGG